MAISGNIIPEPFAIPPITTLSALPASILTACSLWKVSVVIMAFAASVLPVSSEVSPSATSPSCRSINAIFNCAPMGPVDKTATSSFITPKAEATSSAIFSAFFMPCSPVKLFAQPLFAITALIRPFSSCRFVNRRGAAFSLFNVNTPAALPPPSINANPLLPSFLPYALTPFTAQIPPLTSSIFISRSSPSS